MLQFQQLEQYLHLKIGIETSETKKNLDSTNVILNKFNGESKARALFPVRHLHRLFLYTV